LSAWPGKGARVCGGVNRGGGEGGRGAGSAFHLKNPVLKIWDDEAEDRRPDENADRHLHDDEGDKGLDIGDAPDEEGQAAQQHDLHQQAAVDGG
jgi:hypothetical protein